MNIVKCLLLAGAASVTVSGLAAAQSTPLQFRTPNIVTTSGATSVTLNGQTFTNTGLVGMGRLPSSTRDFLGDTFGAFSGMDLLLSTWSRTATGYGGTLYALPDRGPNGIGQVSFSDYAARLSAFNISFTPYTGTANLPAATSSQNQLGFTANGGITLRDFNGNVTTGFDPGTGAASVITQNGIQLPGQTSGTAAGKISIDAEAVRFMRDRSFYVSDEYGANVYYFDAAGRLQGVIRPPAALLPRDAAGNLSYSSLVDPVTGRRPNQGLEGMAITPDGKKLVTLLQSGAMQDTGGGQQNRTNTRLMIYDISGSRTPTAPVADFVVQLPIYTLAGDGGAPNRTAAQSEILALNDSQFLVLSRDGLGLGTGLGNPVFKSVLLIDTSNATNIAGTNFETTTTPIASGGVLNSTIRPVQQVEVVNMLNSTQLARFGENLNNTAPTRLTLGEKWEGMALAPVLEEGAPQDFFLFVGNDNDFLSTTCRVNNQDCAQSVDSDSHVLVYRLTLPTYVDPEYRAAMVAGAPLAIEALDQSGLSVAAAASGDIAAHMDAARRTGWRGEGLGGWVAGTYRDTDHDDFVIPGTNAKSDGFRGTMGVEYGVSESVAIGLVLGYGKSDIDADNGFGAKADGYSYGATVRLAAGDGYVHAGFTLGDVNASDITRPAAYGLTAVGETDASTQAGFLEAGWSVALAETTLTPFVGYNYGRAKFDAYTETGAAGGNVVVPEHALKSSIGRLGIEAAFDMQDVVPSVRAAYNKQFSDNPRTLTVGLASAAAAMGSEALTIPTAKEDFWSIGAGLQGAMGQGLWHIGYTAEIGTGDRLDHVVSAGVGVKF